ncbi:MAG: hypothetical protein SV186_06900 [Candidatus Nanohaloarchaea archaeon]|nr:hypothetical protein [Candidatus Nanohaloarchaea archaeon]
MTCSPALNLLPALAVIGSIVALYAGDRIEGDDAMFYISAGIFPLAAAGLAATGLLAACTVNVLTGGSVAVLIIALLGLAR